MFFYIKKQKKKSLGKTKFKINLNKMFKLNNMDDSNKNPGCRLFWKEKPRS